VYRSKPGALADRTDPALGGSAIEALAVTPTQDRPLMALTDGEVDRACRSRHERDGRRLVALSDDRSVRWPRSSPRSSTLVAHASLTRKPVEPEQHRQRRVLVVVLLRREQKHANSERSRPRVSVGCTCGRRTYWAGLDPIRRVYVGEPVEAAHRPESPIDGRRGEASVLHPCSEQLDVRTRPAVACEERPDTAASCASSSSNPAGRSIVAGPPVSGGAANRRRSPVDRSGSR